MAQEYSVRLNPRHRAPIELQIVDAIPLLSHVHFLPNPFGIQHTPLLLCYDATNARSCKACQYCRMAASLLSLPLASVSQ